MTITGPWRLRLLILGLVAGSAVGQPADPAGDLIERIAVLEQGVAQAESLRAIKRLQYAYGHYVEFGLWHDFADLFAVDALAHYPAGALNREAVRELFLEQVGGGQLGLADGRLYPHFVLQPVVTLDPGGTTAHGRWHVLTLLGGYGGNASWVGSLYENDYVLEGGVWQIAELRTNTQFSGAYASGWTQPRQPAGAASEICENYLLNDCSIAYHYDPGRVGAPVPGPVAARGDRPAEADLRALAARASELEERVARLEDQTAVTNLQHAYGYYVDRRLWDDVADLFAADATLELGLQGVYRGRASIRRALEQFGPQGLGDGELNDHLQLETIVTVAPDGLRANARGIDLALVGRNAAGRYRSELREAVFENRYVQEDGVWKIAAMTLYPRFATDYALGWAEDARPAPVPSESFPPDAPPTTRYEVYPAFSVPPFHFRNPVTGAPPRYPDGVADGIDFGADSGGGDSPAVSAVTAAVELSAGANEPAIGPLAARLDGVELQLARTLAYDAVENAVSAFNFALDEFDGAAARALLTRADSAVVRNLDVAGDNPAILAAIQAPRDPASQRRPAGVLAIHQTLQPVILVSEDGQRARFRLRLLEAAGELNADSLWIAGIYTGEATVVDGVWKLDSIVLDLTWAAEYSAGWASAAPFAAINRAPMDYASPVSGR